MSPPVSARNQNIVDSITQYWKGNHPTDLLSTLESDSPWAVFYATPGTYPDNTRGIVLDHYSATTVSHNGEKEETTYNWSESNGVLSDGSLHWHVLLCDVYVFAFYMYDKNGTPGNGQAVVAVALGPPGGIPDEAKTTAKQAKKAFKKMGLTLSEDYDIVYV